MMEVAEFGIQRAVPLHNPLVFFLAQFLTELLLAQPVLGLHLAGQGLCRSLVVIGRVVVYLKQVVVVRLKERFDSIYTYNFLA